MQKQKNENAATVSNVPIADGSLWGILPSAFDAILTKADNNFQAFGFFFGERDRPETYMQINADGIAVITISGVIAKDSWLADTDTAILARDIEQAAANPGIRGVLLHVDSPGGTVAGTGEVADALTGLRAVKPVFAYTDSQMASAAYWMASTAERVYAYPTSEIGSIGVIAVHRDTSKMDEKFGIKRTFVYNGKYKGMVNTGPLSDEGREYIQDRVDKIYALFVDHVSATRKLSSEAVSGLESKVFLAKDAKANKLIDGIATFNQAYSELRRRIGVMEKNELKTQFGSLHAEVERDGVIAATVETIEQLNPKAAKALQQQGAKAERTRISEIRQSAFANQDGLVDKLIADGTPVDEARKQLILDYKAKQQGSLDRLKATDPGAGLGGDVAHDGGAVAAGTVKIATKDPQEAGRILSRLAKERMRAKTLDWTAAFNQVSAENAELYQVYQQISGRQ